MKPRWVIFDVGGVIFDFRKAFHAVEVHLGVAEGILQEKVVAFFGPGELGKITFEEMWLNLLVTIGKEKEHQHILELWWHELHWVEDTKQLIRQLHAAGYKLALFTNNWKGMGAKVKQDMMESELLHAFFESSVEKLRKPDPKFFHLVEKRINAKGQDVFFIDDTKENILAAKERGWQVFHYALSTDNGKSSNNAIRKILLA